MTWRTLDPAAAAAAAATIVETAPPAPSSTPLDERTADERATDEEIGGDLGDLGTREQRLTMSAAAVKMATGIAARFLGEQWRAKPEELRELAPAVLDVYEHEFGEMPADPWARLYLALALFAMPRLLPRMFELAEPPQPPQPPKPIESTTVASTPTPARAPTSSTFVEELDNGRELAEIKA